MIIQDTFLKVYKISIFFQVLLVKCGNPGVWHTTGLGTFCINWAKFVLDLFKTVKYSIHIKKFFNL